MSIDGSKRVLIIGDSFCTGVNNLLPLNQRISGWFLLSRVMIALVSYLPAALFLTLASTLLLAAGSNERARKLGRKFKWTRQYLFWHFNQHWLSDPKINCFTDLLQHLRQNYHERLDITCDAGIYRFAIDLTEEKLKTLFKGPAYDYILIYLGINDVGQSVPNEDIGRAIARLASAIKTHSPDAMVGYVEQPNLYYHMTSQRLLAQNFITLPFGLKMTPSQLDKLLGGMNNAPIFRNTEPQKLRDVIFGKLKVVNTFYEEELTKHCIKFFKIPNFHSNPDSLPGFGSLFSLDCFHPNRLGYAAIYGKNSISSFERKALELSRNV